MRRWGRARASRTDGNRRDGTAAGCRRLSARAVLTVFFLFLFLFIFYLRTATFINNIYIITRSCDRARAFNFNPFEFGNPTWKKNPPPSTLTLPSSSGGDIHQRSVTNNNNNNNYYVKHHTAMTTRHGRGG